MLLEGVLGMTDLTQQELKRAFMELLREYPLSKITVSKITERCGVSRNTFYYHFHDVYELLDVILREDQQALIESHAGTGTWDSILVDALGFVMEERVAVYNIFNSLSHDRLEGYLFNTATDLVRRITLPQLVGHKVSRKDYDNLVRLLAAAIEGLVLNWFRDGMKDDLREYVVEISRLLDGFVVNLLARDGEARPSN
jgi:AcrR family transcriptional regulator